MGSALVFPLSENGVSLKIVGTPYDREIIDECIRTGRNPKLPRPFPSGISFYQFEDWKKAMIREMVVIEIAAGMKSETTGGNEADDENHDVWLEEEEKNGLTGER